MNFETFTKEEMVAPFLSKYPTKEELNIKQFLGDGFYFNPQRIQHLIEEYFLRDLKLVSIDLEVERPCIHKKSPLFDKIKNKSPEFGFGMGCSVLTVNTFDFHGNIETDVVRTTLEKKDLEKGHLNEFLKDQIVVGFNSNSFDLPLLQYQKYIDPNINFDTFDLLHNIWLDMGLSTNKNDYNNYTHGGVGLEKLCQLYFNTKKPIKTYEETFYDYEQTNDITTLANLSHYDSLNTLYLTIIYLVAIKYNFVLPPLKRQI